MSDLAARMALKEAPIGLSTPDGDDCDDDVRMLYLDAENSQRDVVRRFGLMEYEYNGELRKRLFYRSFPDIAPLNTLEGAGRVIDFIEAKRINFVVADTLSKFIDGNENDPGPYTDFAKNLLNYLRKSSITSVWFDHTGHVEKQRARGSSAKKDNLDAGWQMELKDRNPRTGISKIEMTPGKNRSGALAPRLWVTRHGAPLPYVRHEFSTRASRGRSDRGGDRSVVENRWTPAKATAAVAGDARGAREGVRRREQDSGRGQRAKASVLPTPR